MECAALAVRKITYCGQKNTPTHYQTPGYREANYVQSGRLHDFKISLMYFIVKSFLKKIFCLAFAALERCRKFTQFVS